MKTPQRIAIAAAAVVVGFAAIALSGAVAPVAHRLAGDANAPWGRFLSAAPRALGRLRDAALRGFETAAERDALRAERDALRAEALETARLREENARLRSELRLAGRDAAGGGRLIACDVLSFGGASSWRPQLRLSRGEADGIRVGQAVISPDGLVGRVVETSLTTASVLPIYDEASRVAVEIRTRNGPARSILAGRGLRGGDADALRALCIAAPMTADWIGKTAEAGPGDQVFTSGLGGVYPPGIPVGRVLSAEPDETRLWQRADVAPLADFHTLRRVFVIAGEGEGGR